MTRTSLRVDVEEWMQELTAVWKPSRILEVRNQGTLGLLLIAQLHPGLTLHLRIQWDGVDMCTLWQGRRYVLWDRVVGFCPPSRYAPALAAAAKEQPVPEGQEEEEWEARMRLLIRRNCFLMGCNMEATDEEKRQWLDKREASTPLDA